MAPGGILLGAEQGDAGRPGPGHNLVEAFLERRARGEPAVEHVALLVVELLTRRAAAEFPAERDEVDLLAGQGRAERSGVEMRHVAGPRHGTHVGHGLDAVPLQEGQEMVERLVRMADREQARSVIRHRPAPPGVPVRVAAAIAVSQCRRYSG